MVWPRWWRKAVCALGLILGLALGGFIIPAEAAQQYYPVIVDIIKVRLYDKLYIRWLLVSNPSEVFQAYTSFLYEYRLDLFRYGWYDDIFGWAQAEAQRLCNYDLKFLASNRFNSKELLAFGIEVLSPRPQGYFYQTYLLCGVEAATGVPFKLGIHNGEVWGTFILSGAGEWVLWGGRDPFVDGLAFEYVPLKGGHCVLDLLYYTDGAIDSFTGPMALDDRIRVFSLRSAALEWTPDAPIVTFPPPPS